jgi:hypothetical protein
MIGKITCFSRVTVIFRKSMHRGMVHKILILFMATCLIQSCTGKLTMKELARNPDAFIKITAHPEFPFRYAVMEEGVIQHVDRPYTFDVIPTQLKGGLLFQGIHRLPGGTCLEIELMQPTWIYFFFHQTEDGGYGKIFPTLQGWERCPEAPQYDTGNGNHGLHMVMYRMKAGSGTVTIPCSTKDKACFNMLFLPV